MTTQKMSPRIPCPIRFGEGEGLEKYLHEVELARSAMTCDFAVAPRISLTTRGGVLHAGDEVTLDALGGTAEEAVAQLRKLVEAGRVIQRGGYDPGAVWTTAMGEAARP